MASRFRHGYANDIFLSYTHVDDEPGSGGFRGQAGMRWVTRFLTDLQARLRFVSGGKDIRIWRDESSLTAADRFDETIAQAVCDSAILLVILSPGYFDSEYCRKELETFDKHARDEHKESIGTKARIVKVARFRVGLEKYPERLRELLEYKFFEEDPLSHICREFHLSENPDAGAARYMTRVDEVAQELNNLLTGMEPAVAVGDAKGMVYLAETTSDLEPQRDELRRHLVQLGFDVEPKGDLRFRSAPDMRRFVADTLERCRLTIHPVGAYYGFVPEGEEGSTVQIQLELAKATSRNGDLPKIIWVPEKVEPKQDRQRDFLNRIRTEFAGRGFEFLERPYHDLAACVDDRLRAPISGSGVADSAPSGVYLVCGSQDRSLAKTVKAFLFNQRLQVELPPVEVNSDELTDHPKHKKLLSRNAAHLVLHGETNEDWIQDRIRELYEQRRPGTSLHQAILLANPRREDKDEILVREIDLLNGYPPALVPEALKPYVDQVVRAAQKVPPPGTQGPQDNARGAGGSV